MHPVTSYLTAVLWEDKLLSCMFGGDLFDSGPSDNDRGNRRQRGVSSSSIPIEPIWQPLRR